MSQTMRPERKQAALYISLIFLCGALAGAVATNLWLRVGPQSVSARADLPHSPQRVVGKFTRELNLSPEQAQELNKILDETHQAYQVPKARMEEIRQQGRVHIREILNEQQKAKYEEILAQIDAKRQRRP